MTAGSPLGRVHIITGPGKGKTTAAFGLAMRAAGHGLRVCIIQFMKTGDTAGEAISARLIPGIELHRFGTGSFVDARSITGEDSKCAEDALALARSKLSGGEYQLVVLDEVNFAAHLGLVSTTGVLRAVKSRPAGVEVVLTGRNAPMEFIDAGDYVSVIDSWKHPFDQGIEARQGIEW